MRPAHRSKKKARARRPPPLRVLPPAAPPSPAPLDELERERAARLPDPAEALLERQRLVDQQRGERSEQVARHARETAELLTRHVDEERKLEHRHQVEMGRLREGQGGAVGPWLEHQSQRGPRG